MANRLTEKQTEALRQFRLTTHATSSSLSIEAIELLNSGPLKNYLNILRQHIDARDEKVAASILVKRYAFLPVIYLYALTAWNLKLDISCENVSLERRDQDGHWLLGFRFKHLGGESAGKDRDQWREDCIRSLFNDHVFPIMDLISKEAKISKLILWENIAIYIFWLYETVLSAGEASLAERAAEDFRYIMKEAPGALFGGYNENPLKRYNNEKVFAESKGKTIRPRKTCCFSYLTNSAKHCGTCPQICKKIIKEGGNQDERKV